MKKRYILLVGIWCIIIFAFASSRFYNGENTLMYIQILFGLDYNQAEVLNAFVRKGAHVFIFGTLAVIIYFMLKRRFFFLPLGVTTLFAIADEYNQSLVPGRTALVSDVLLDSLAAFLFLVIARRYFADSKGKNLSYDVTKE
ncbi:VanZ family protein [Mesobacillus foraminis]|uniref:VanZ family protein n=1 Tax=Mesobacillus foraminis TaxID=279826 RepID=A0A4R2B786_9BACI|nr:VanZ family protein [Mesobacillus foraminis]TCN22213.1 VanZ family protein [Mesobacillus foraminis]